jgi:hydroxysqualene dehydroxylase
VGEPIHIVGAGVAGLAAALHLTRHDERVVLHEATPQAGGRARALPDGTDNGTHALLSGNRTMLALLDAIGAREGWIEPEPAGLPVLDRADGSTRHVALTPWAWWRGGRPDGLTAGAAVTLLRMGLGGTDRTVAEAFAHEQRFLRGFVEPLAIAVLNTPAREASTRRLAQALREAARPGAARLLVAREGLGPDLVAPALATLAARGATIRHGARLRALTREGTRITALDFGDHTLPATRVLLALPPWEATRLIPGLPAPTEHAPILNLHFARAAETPVRFLGLLSALCQWVLVRPSGIAVTVSAADAETDEDTATLAPRAWAEIRHAARAFALPGDWPEAPPPCRAVKERRATPRQRPGPPPIPPRRPLENCALAGDWTYAALPATLEAAARSAASATSWRTPHDDARRSARRAARGRRRHAGARRRHAPRRARRAAPRAAAPRRGHRRGRRCRLWRSLPL